MDWKTLLACVTGSVDEELLLREVWTLGRLVTSYVLFFIKLDTREIQYCRHNGPPPAMCCLLSE
jgi:hypothetical protein